MEAQARAIGDSPSFSRYLYYVLANEAELASLICVSCPRGHVVCAEHGARGELSITERNRGGMMFYNAISGEILNAR